jgi:hypothetical protein
MSGALLTPPRAGLKRCTLVPSQNRKILGIVASEGRLTSAEEGFWRARRKRPAKMNRSCHQPNDFEPTIRRRPDYEPGL